MTSTASLLTLARSQWIVIWRRSPDGHQMGQITVVGGASVDLPATLRNVDMRRASRTGPGYHDEAWERGGDYPPVFMRWTTQANLELCMRLIAEGKLDVDCLTTHRIPLERAEEEIAAIIDDPDEILGPGFPDEPLMPGRRGGPEE